MESDDIQILKFCVKRSVWRQSASITTMGDWKVLEYLLAKSQTKVTSLWAKADRLLVGKCLPHCMPLSALPSSFFLPLH